MTLQRYRRIRFSASKRLRKAMSGATLDRDSVRLLAVAWGLVLIGAVVLVLGYGSSPGAVVLDRPPWADAPIGAKSFLTVGRIFLMGVGQLGAATVMVLASRGSAPWERFWRWLALSQARRRSSVRGPLAASWQPSGAGRNVVYVRLRSGFSP